MSARDEALRRNLELLVPEGGGLRERAGAVAESAADLLRDGEPAVVREVQLSFDLEVRARAAGALEDLLAHHLRAIHGGRSFLTLPRPRAGLQAAWGTLVDLRVDDPELPGVPGPGEGALAVAARLCAGLHRLDHDPQLLELWAARLEHARGGARAGERAFRERLEATPSSGPGSRTFHDLALGVAESLLDRGAVREAAELVRALPQRREGAAARRLDELDRLLALLLGEREPDDGPEAGGEERELPSALVALREDWPAARAALSGRPASTVAPVAWSPLPVGQLVEDRRELGALTLAILALDAGRTPRALHVDTAPALRGRIDSWLGEGEDACCDPLRPEHALVLEARAQRLHGAPPPAVLGARARAAALVPVLDDEGEAAGWVHLEWAHHLVPDPETLRAVAEAWRPLVLRARRREADDGAGGDLVRERAGCGLEERDARLCGATFEALAAACGMKLRLRRWWGFVVEGDEVHRVASGGEGLPGDEEQRGGGRALERCLATTGVVRHDEPDPRLSLHAASNSGVVLPLLDAGRVRGMFAVESERRRDFRGADVEAHAELARRFAPALALARFRAWHIERYGHDLHLDASHAPARARVERLAAAARSSAPVVLCGPAGAGKGVLARWVHWNRGRGEQTLEQLRAGVDLVGEDEREAFAARLARDRGGLVIDSPERLAAGLQEELLRFLEGEVPGVGPEVRGRLVLTTRRPLAESVLEGELRPELAARLDRLQVHLPGLRDRRRELPGLVRFLAARLASEEGVRPPEPDDEALALLWRQDWPGNLRELEALVFKLVLLHPGEAVGVDAVRAVAGEFQLQLRERLPSRRPRREDLVQALRTTRKGTGRPNKRRAALYLGWDPDTLVLRMEDAGLTGEALDELLEVD